MSSILFLYNEILYRPIFNALVFIYTTLPLQDLGVAIILLTIVTRVVLTPFFWKARKSQQELAILQPEIKKVQERFKNDKEAQGKAMMELYKEKKVNPFSGCLILLIQFPLLIALFQVFQGGLDPAQLSLLYSFASNPGTLNPLSFGLLDLGKGNLYLGVLAALAQYGQTKMSIDKKSMVSSGEFSRMMSWQMLYLFPAFILIWSYKLPAALTLYWTVLSVLGIVQEIIMKKYGPGGYKKRDPGDSGKDGIRR